MMNVMYDFLDNDAVASLGDNLSTALVVATIADILPAIAALTAILWHGLNIYFKYIRRP